MGVGDRVMVVRGEGWLAGWLAEQRACVVRSRGMSGHAIQGGVVGGTGALPTPPPTHL